MFDAFAKSSTRQKLVETSIELFKAHGTDAVSVKDICDSASVTRNAFYYHFASKEKLFEDIGDWVFFRSRQRLSLLLPHLNYYQRIWEIYYAYIITQLEMGPDIMNHICIARSSQDLDEDCSYIRGDIGKALIELIRAAQDAGQIQNLSSPEVLLPASYALVRGNNIRWCFMSGKSELVKDAIRDFNTLFLPAAGFELNPESYK